MKPYTQRPRSANGAVTGSVAMNATPKAQPPSTMCHQNGTAYHGLVCEPIALNTSAMAMVPSAQPTMIRHEPTLVTAMMTAPIRQANADVSPIEPGSKPKKARNHEKPAVSNGCVITRSWPSSVAPEKPSIAAPSGTAVHTLSPEISAG